MKITQLYKEYVIRGWWKLPSYTGIISHGKVIMFHFHLNFLESLGKSHFPSNKNATDIGRNRSVHYEGGRWKEGQRLWESSERVKIFFAPRIHGNDIVEWCIWMICFFCLRKVSKYIIQSYRSFGGWKKRKKNAGMILGCEFTVSQVEMVFGLQNLWSTTTRGSTKIILKITWLAYFTQEVKQKPLKRKSLP